MLLTDRLTAIANAIRSKTGKTEQIPLANMPAEINEASDRYLADVLNLNCTEINNEYITAPVVAGFQKTNKKLISVSLPNVTGTIGESAFNACSNLLSVSLPKATGLGNGVFYNSTKL
jgi:ABC-type transporter lipoprotein component MlaA